MKNSYMIQNKKPSYYRSKIKRARKVNLGEVKSYRNAQSNDPAARYSKPLQADISRSMDALGRAESPGTKALRMKKKILTQKVSKSKAPEIKISENSQPAREMSVPPLLHTPANKPLSEMSAIEYYWFHKNQHDAQNSGMSSTKSIGMGLSEKPASQRSKREKNVETPEKIRRMHEQKQREIEEKKQAEIERKLDIDRKVKDHLVIAMEDPVEVSRRLRKKSKRSVRRNEDYDPTQETLKKKNIVKKEKKIKKDGIYYIKDAESKKISMPKLANLNPKIFEMFAKERVEARNEAEHHTEPNQEKKRKKRHINIAGTNPLASTDYKKSKKKSKSVARNEKPSQKSD
eukprot:CAMPEP_0197000370 /NCGR_PEP_ID=MMETSP1380-20130617/5336_1 /TAXON_ID=5936 /ORGANISM="Euplotes crassus, Strain CT5" /LENGTH=344 /DNA_ID=CAMNT_0042417645 /DNA_START=42 /DNA_END=1076 /DNA_ORIENTATION=-